MIYSSDNKNFKHHVHTKLQKRIRIFLVLSTCMLLAVLWDVVTHVLTIPVAALSIIIGSVIGWFTSRIFHVSWDKDGETVVGKIDTIGWFVLGAYIVFEIARAVLFETVIHLGDATTTAITFAFVSSALLSRVFGLRGRILTVLRDEKVFK